ncbi:MAG: hypothetical protein E5W74_15180 [Mesorhizobium sp.]|uniref:hypothetical protein n=1 Tax=Mesorhizobium sp. TaxID=1871066 RepID=UPI001216B34E|nr:hypothetical protein [Mesorhizobium sp.]TIT10814.1 MAG: hypothetical protein E5W74_15180 [Mesorhizobium sp.]
MTVIRIPDGWIVTASAKATAVIAGPFETMAEGWRWIDRAQGEPVSRGENMAEWIWSKEAAR